MARAKKEAALTPEERLQTALVPDWEWPYKLPENWCWTKIGSISSLHRGVSYKKTDAHTERRENSCLVMRGGNICEGSIDTEADNIYVDISLVAENQIVRKNDIIIVASTGSTKVIGRAGISKMDYLDVAFGAFLLLVRPSTKVNQRYIDYFFLSDNYRNRIKKLASGININNIRGEYITETLVPLAPLAEQQRIVDRIESLFAKLDEAKEKAQAVVDSFETRKAAILHKAFTGELTAKWREEHNISKTTWGEKKWGDFLQSIEAGKNWSAEGRPPEGTEFGVVKVSAVTWGEFDELESKTCVVAEQWNSKTQIHKGDFLFSRANTLQLVGNCVIVRNISKRLMLSDKILRFKFDEIAHPRFVLYFTRSRIYREQVEQLASGNQDGMRNISQKNLKLVFFPIPTVVEQIEIISILDRAFAKEQQAKEAAEAVLDEIDLMKKSILARAFRGELGTNDPNEESAVELLKRTIL